MRISGSTRSSSIYCFLSIFLKICTFVLSSINKNVCRKYFFKWKIVLQMDNIKENLERAGSYILQEIMFSDFSLYLQNITKQEKFSRHICWHCRHYKMNTCSKFQIKIIISTRQINKLIMKNGINSKGDKDDNNMNYWYSKYTVVQRDVKTQKHSVCWGLSCSDFSFHEIFKRLIPGGSKKVTHT